MTRVYDPGAVLELLAGNSEEKQVRQNVKGLLKAGAHPFFVHQMVRLITERLKGMDWTAASYFQEVATKALTGTDPTSGVPDKMSSGVLGAISRALRSDVQIEHLDRGVLHGIFVETHADVVAWYNQNKEQAREAWKSEMELFHASASRIPMVDFELYDSLNYVLHETSRNLGFEDMKPNSTLLDEFVDRRAAAAENLPDFVKDFLAHASAWDVAGDWRWIYHSLEALGKKYELPGARFLRTMLDLRPRDGWPYQVAQRMLDYPPVFPEPFGDLFEVASSGLQSLIHQIRLEMPHREARRALLRWLVRSQVLKTSFLLLFGFYRQDDQIILSREFEFLIQEVFGPEAWPLICKIQDQKYWIQEEGSLLLRFRDELYASESAAVVKAARSSPASRHNPDVAEAFEDLIADAGTSEEEAAQILEESLDILSGDLVLVSTHLRDEWMQVRRRKGEVLGATLPRIDVARHSKFGDRGAACKFRIPVPDKEKMVIRGNLGPEGELYLENTPLLEVSAQALVRAAVAETVCVVLVPDLVTEPVIQSDASGPSVRTGEPWASRPILRVVGEIGGTQNNEEASIQGSRLNLNIVAALFEWLVAERGKYPFRLFLETSEKVGRGCETFFVTRPGAKELLRRKQISLSQVYIRAVRAHTRPLGAYLDKDDQTIKIRSMSAKAERNYRRYREDGGRELDFSEVQKTYLLPNGLRVPLQIPRTFNQGCFISLADASQLVYDDELNAAIREMFVL
jgi:hypothetical protein